MLLLTGKELEISPNGVEQYLRITIVQIGASQKVSADHLQAVSARLVGSQHQSSRLDGLLDDGNLTLVKLEVNNLPRFCFLSGQLLLNFPLKFFFWHLASLVQPGCTIELLPVPPGHLGQLQPLGPAHLL